MNETRPYGVSARAELHTNDIHRKQLKGGDGWFERYTSRSMFVAEDHDRLPLGKSRPQELEAISQVLNFAPTSISIGV